MVNYKGLMVEKEDTTKAESKEGISGLSFLNIFPSGDSKTFRKIFCPRNAVM